MLFFMIYRAEIPTFHTIEDITLCETKNSLSCWRLNSSLYSAYFFIPSSSDIESSYNIEKFCIIKITRTNR